jgi:hypothetical protein
VPLKQSRSCCGAARGGGFGRVWRQCMKDTNDTIYDLMTSLVEIR